MPSVHVDEICRDVLCSSQPRGPTAEESLCIPGPSPALYLSLALVGEALVATAAPAMTAPELAAAAPPPAGAGPVWSITDNLRRRSPIHSAGRRAGGGVSAVLAGPVDLLTLGSRTPLRTA